MKGCVDTKNFFFHWYRLLPTIPRDSRISSIPRWKAGKRPNKWQDPFPKEKREAIQCWTQFYQVQAFFRIHCTLFSCFHFDNIVNSLFDAGRRTSFFFFAPSLVHARWTRRVLFVFSNDCTFRANVLDEITRK